MAMSKESKQVERNLKGIFADIDGSSKRELFNRVSEINKERDDEINKTAIDLVSEQYLRDHFGYVGTTPADKEMFVKQLSLEQKLEIIGEYTNERQIFEGNQGILVKLQDIAKRKAENKLRYKQEALELIQMYEKVLIENKTKIQTLETDIERTKANIASAEAKLQEIIGKDDEALAYAGRQSTKFDKDKAIAAMKENIENLKTKLSEQERLLGELKGIQAKFEVEFNKRKSEIETELQAQNIFVYDRKAEEAKMDAPQEETKTTNQEENEGAKDNTGGSATKKIGDKEIAKAMMDDFFNLSPEDQRKLLDRMDNQGILDMARKLGQINRAKLNVILNARLDELQEDNITFGGEDITKEELRDMKHMNPNKLRAIRRELDEFNRDFSRKSIDEIEEFESKLQYVRVGALLAETGAFRGIGRFWDSIKNGRNGNSIFELSKSFARYAEIKGKRTEEKEDWKDSLRVAIGRKPMNDLAKDGSRRLNRDPKSTSRFKEER